MIFPIETQEPLAVRDGKAVDKAGVVLQDGLVRDGEDAIPRCSGFLQLRLDPCEGLVRDRVAPGVGVAVDEENAQTRAELADIAERMRVRADRLVIAEGGVDAAKVGGGDALGRGDLIALEAGGVGAVQIVVARENEDGDALCLERGALGGKRLVALALAVEGEVAGEDSTLPSLCLPHRQSHRPDVQGVSTDAADEATYSDIAPTPPVSWHLLFGHA